MIRQIIFIIIFLTGHLTSPVFAVGKGPVYMFLKEPAVKWNDERLTGEVKNAPVKKPIIHKTRRIEPTGEEMAVIENEMRAFADEMLAERTITNQTILTP